MPKPGEPPTMKDLDKVLPQSAFMDEVQAAAQKRLDEDRAKAFQDERDREYRIWRARATHTTPEDIRPQVEYLRALKAAAIPEETKQVIEEMQAKARQEEQKREEPNA